MVSNFVLSIHGSGNVGAHAGTGPGRRHQGMRIHAKSWLTTWEEMGKIRSDVKAAGSQEFYK